MREEYEQLELDTRRQLDKAIAQLTEDTVKTAGEMITACGEAPTAVRNRHEAFGIAAERLAKIKKAVKARPSTGTRPSCWGRSPTPTTQPLRPSPAFATAPWRQPPP